VAAYTLKSLRMLQVGEQLADEGKNHAELILVEARLSVVSQFEFAHCAKPA
jgi:hypothetical protein